MGFQPSCPPKIKAILADHGCCSFPCAVAIIPGAEEISHVSLGIWQMGYALLEFTGELCG
jgi:hypothetical protein